MRKFSFTETPAFSKSINKMNPMPRKEINSPSVLLKLPSIFFSLDALFFICFNLDQVNCLPTKIIELLLHLLLILSFFILKKYYMSPMAHNIAFLFVRTCHLIVLMECEEWTGNIGKLRIIVNGIKLFYLEFIFFFLFNSSKFFMTSLVSNLVYIGIRVPVQALFDYFHLLLLLAAVMTAIIIIGKEKKTNFFLVKKKKAPKLKKALSFKRFLKKFPESTIDHFMEEIEEGIVLFDDEFEVIKQNHKFIDLINKIGKYNGLDAFFSAEISALKEGTDDLKLWCKEMNFNFAINKNDNTIYRNKEIPNSGLTLNGLLAQMFPIQAKKINPFVFLSSSQHTTMNIKNLDSQNLKERFHSDSIKVKVELFFPNEGSFIYVELSILPINTFGSFNFLFILNETTQNYMLTKMMLKSANKTKAVSYVSHEMRTPLNCIIGMLNMMEPLLDQKYHEEFLLPALSSAKCLLNLLNDLLDIAQIQAGTFKLVLVEIELKKLLFDVLSMIEIQAKAKGLLIFFDYDEAIPIFIKTDPNRLRQIITNLLGNALKFTQKGCISLRATLDSFDNCLIHLFVIDNGIGIKEENKKLLFTAFGKVDNGENEYLNSQGVGLGLLISNKLAISVGPNPLKYGKIESTLNPLLNPGLNVFSEYEKGTTFRFILEDRNQGVFRSFNSQSSLQEKLNELKRVQSVPRLLAHLNEGPSVNFDTQLNPTLTNELKLEKNITEAGFDKKIKKSKFYDNFFTTVTKSKEEIKFGEKSMTIKKEEKDLESWSIQVKSSCVKKTLFSEQKSVNSKSKDEVPKAINGCGNGCPAFLVCDDDHFNIKVLQNFLQVYGLPIETAYHGDIAIERVKKRWESEDCCKSYMLIFMDIEMPQKNGIEAAEEIIFFWKEKGEVGCPIIATTGYVEEEEEEKIVKSGMTESISKPINNRDLRKLVERLLILKNNVSN